MAIGSIPSYLQNASHSASVFRIAQSAPFATGGVLASNELAVAQQASPNMSIILGPGRAEIVGTSVSPPVGLNFTTQGMYTAYNDANLTLTIAASNPTNPRIDAVYIQIQDSFYSGATNTAVAAVATGTPAVSPVAPAIPANSILIAYIAVAANATTIVTANITGKITYAALASVGTQLTTFDTNTVVAKDFVPIIRTGYTSGTTSAGGVLTHTFNTPFPTACLGVILMPDSSSNFAANNPPVLTNGTITASGFQSFWGGHGSAASNLAYIAIGY